MEEKTKVIQEMDTLEAQKFVQKYVCATCWGNLTKQWVEGKHHIDRVFCDNPNCSGNGFVTRKYAERKLDQDHIDFIEARHNLEKVLNLPNPNKGKTADQLINELGL